MTQPGQERREFLDAEVRDYLHRLADEPDALLARLEGYAGERGFPKVGYLSGRWLEQFARSVNARRVYEFGSGFGYSAYFFAKAVGGEGEVWGSEVDAHELEAFERLYAQHPLKNRIHLRLGDAIEVFDQVDGMMDVVFIDADKADYRACLEAAVPRLRIGGLLMADNALWGGRTSREGPSSDESTEHLRRFNRAVYADSRFQTSILPVGDGLLVALRV